MSGHDADPVRGGAILFWSMGATDLARLYRSGKVSPVEATAAVLTRPGEVNGAPNAAVTLPIGAATAISPR